MKITTKINLLTTAWMVCIMVLINFVVVFLFIKTTVNMERDVQYEKAEEMIRDLNDSPGDQTMDILQKNLTNHSFIRIIQQNGHVVQEAATDKYLSRKLKARFVEKRQSSTHVISRNSSEEEVLLVRVPFKDAKSVPGTLEIGERLAGLETRIETLRAILWFGTLLAALLSLLGGRWLANLIMRPISAMVHTMEAIEKSGVPQEITLRNKSQDELHTLGNTFNRMIGRLQENMDKQSQFVSDASHELKTPLTIIKSYANLLRRHGFHDEQMAAEAIQAIHSEATRMQKMAETMLDLAALQRDNPLSFTDIDLVELCEEIQKQFKNAYKRDIAVSYHENPILINADEMRLKQVILILLDNAIKYSQEKIEVGIGKKETHAFVSIKDYGIGIPPEEIGNIFERFYRVDKARSRQTGGSGLGLNIANSIVKLHKGEIKISSTEGEGTIVTVILPAER